MLNENYLIYKNQSPSIKGELKFFLQVVAMNSVATGKKFHAQNVYFLKRRVWNLDRTLFLVNEDSVVVFSNFKTAQSL